MSIATGELGGRGHGLDIRHTITYALLGLALALFYISASVFYYGDSWGIFADVLGLFKSLVTFDFISLIDFAPLFTLAFFIGLCLRVYTWTFAEGAQTFSGSLLTDQGFRSIFFELTVFTVLGVFVWWVLGNTIQNLAAAKIASGFGFLETTAGFGLNQTLIQYSEESSYGRALMVGLVNTVVLAFIGIVFATIIGFIVGIMRLSKNWVISKIATAYIETLRNVPLLLQILVWYNAVLKPLPSPRQALNPGGSVFITNRGIYLPKLVPEAGFGFVVIAFLGAIAASIAISIWARRRQEATGEQFPVFLTSLGLIVGAPVLAFLILGMPLSTDLPALAGFNFRGGWSINPEFIAMFLALSIYTGAFIAEIVRAGIQAVSHGQTEAASALGLRRGLTLRLVVIPQALRVIIPPLTSQYLNLTKNSSLATAIAYQDLVAVGGTVLNQTGQAIEIIAVWMMVYLSLSILTSIFMNWYNAKMALVER